MYSRLVLRPTGLAEFGGGGGRGATLPGHHNVKDSRILSAPYNPSLVKRDGHVTFDNAFWA